MSRIELEYHSKELPESKPFHMEGNIFFRGVGRFEIRPNEDNTVYVGSIDRLVDPRNSRCFANVLPGKFYKIVRPNAILVVRNVLSET